MLVTCRPRAPFPRVNSQTSLWRIPYTSIPATTKSPSVRKVPGAFRRGRGAVRMMSPGSSVISSLAVATRPSYRPPSH